MNINDIREALDTRKDRSAWDKGVTLYALELLDEYAMDIEHGYKTEASTLEQLKKDLLNGADDWKDYSEGGSALIYDVDIAERLCTKTELKKTRNAERRPNRYEGWLDVQTRALYQAMNRIAKLFTA